MILRGEPPLGRVPNGLIAVLGLSVLLGVSSDEWLQVAEHDLTFIKHMSAEEIRYGPVFFDEVIRGKVFEFGCDPRPSRLAGLNDAQIRQINLYSAHHCNPWHAAWASQLQPCEGRLAPAWCKSGKEELLAARLKIGEYFQKLTTALRNSDNVLERRNTMAVVAERLDDKYLRELPKSIVGAWVGAAMPVFLERADPDDAIDIGWSLYIMPHADIPLLAGLIRTYLTHAPKVTAEQQQLLEKLSRGLPIDDIPFETREVLSKRITSSTSPSSEPPTHVATDPAQFALLVTRVHAYYGLLQDAQYDQSFGFVSNDYREAGHAKDSYIRTQSVIHRLLRWKVVRIQVSGGRARVLTEIRRRDKHSNEGVANETTFWIFESGTWNNMVRWPDDWEDTNAIDITLPT